MSEQASWMEINEQHLAATVGWIRMRLERLVQPPDNNEEATKKGGWFKRSEQTHGRAKDHNKPAPDSEAIELARQEFE